jgi:GNAT superfamily N-acetyltransferase
LEIRRLTRADVAAVLRLAGLAGWNQTDKDIERLLALAPDGCFAACAGGRVVGTTTTTSYGTDLAWVGMVLVDPDFRRRGIATALMQTALDHLRGLGVTTIKLDATPAGRAVYERFGFEPECALERRFGPAPAGPPEGASAASWAEIAVPDRVAFGADRGPLLRALIGDAGAPLLVRRPGGQIAGYGLARPGARAGYVGPVVADDVRTAGILVPAAAARCGGIVFIDIDPAFPGAVGLMDRLGFSRQRELLRMRLGPGIVPTGPLRVFSIAGPAVG